MRTIYVKPETTIYEIETEQLLAASELTSNGLFDDEEGMVTGAREHHDNFNIWED